MKARLLLVGRHHFSPRARAHPPGGLVSAAPGPNVFNIILTRIDSVPAKDWMFMPTVLQVHMLEASSKVMVLEVETLEGE